MLQRVQSVYLLIVFALLLISLLFPLISFDEGVKMVGYGFMKDGINVYVPYGVFCIGGLSAFLAFVEIFLFKNRKLQMKIGLLNSFVIIFYYVTIAVYAIVVGNGKLGLQYETMQVTLILPFIALVFNVLAYLKIRADEKLVRSLDRIR